jgi:serine/threonine-protein kinase
VSFIGSTLGNIRIDSRLGSGGMGEVYLGFDRRLERRVALKTIRPEQRLSPAVKARFLREARLLSKLGHPGICQVYDLLETSEADFLVLEYIEGKTLRQLAEEEELPLERKLRLAAKIADALAAAHREQVVHRDLKPENVMVTPAGEVKVLDFGVARSLTETPLPAAEVHGMPPSASEAETQPAVMAAAWMPPPLTEQSGQESGPETGAPEALTHFGMVVGTIWTMSPEQASGQPVTTASDLYSFGVLLQELLTGKPVYTGGSMQEVWRQVVRAETVPVIGLDPDVTALVSDLLNLDPRRRPTAEQARARLLWILDKPQRLRRRRLRLALVSGAFVVLVVLLAVVTWLAAEAERARREADQRRRQAEDLIGFMLGDLRPKLEEVGRLDILDEVGDRAMAYFQAVPRASWSDEELARRAEAILQIGQVRWAQGSLPQALATFRAAAVLADELARRAPSHPKAWNLRYDAHSWIGQAFFDQGENEKALAEWRRALELANEDLRRRPESVEAQRSVGTAYHNLGSVLDARGDLEGALRSYQASLERMRPLAARHPPDVMMQSQIAATLAYISNDLEATGDLAAALAERRDHLAIFERLAPLSPEDNRVRQDLATARGFTAGLLTALGRLDDAESLYRQGLAAIADLAGRDPQNTDLRRWLGAFHGGLGRVLLERGDAAGALAEMRQSTSLFQELSVQDPTNVDWRRQLGISQGRTATALLTLDPVAARDEARQALSLLAPLAAGSPDESIRGYAADAAVALGRAEEALGDTPAARAAREKALTFLAGCRRPLRHWKLLDPWIQAELGLGRRDEALPELRRLLAMGYRGREIVTLGRREGVGAP